MNIDYLSKFPLPVTGVGLREVPGPESFRNIPEADVGALGVIQQEVELLRLSLHLGHLVSGQLEQAFNLFLESFHSLEIKSCNM